MRDIITPDALFFFDRHPGALSLYEALASRLLARYPGAQPRVQKTQISFYDGRMFACASLAAVLPKSRRPEPFLTVSFGLDGPVESPRLVAVPVRPNRWTHHAVIGSAAQIDDELLGWIDRAHALAAGRPEH